ncbi:iron-sulfur-binding ferredoxin reductase [Ectopseudomonas alcaliphila]|uniref:Iron-sulfur-binding ferredoxin reductase n=1 Tax=Ectopseudomonas alcaliphila TaxID=101564 RepID=A0A1G7K8N4_9GAMM|nr:iron-sulfur-binding ferredoxin reductase [Pseudomonas alcaliphila]MDX5994643.1 iron-sulfur-binding ferredoxin reductase [Pseudomonas alcaliphila]SDF33532.1 NAD(P)H-flavin reductase [Pseudomonas alcaliphila]
MPELRVGDQRLQVAQQTNLLDALLGGAVAVPYSCRAGSCHACLVRCVAGEPLDLRPEALAADKRAEGWRLACQCQVVGDLQVEPFDPQRDGLAAKVVALDWPSPQVLRLRLQPGRPLRYRPGQHLLLWHDQGVARPYSLASVPGEDDWLEFHIDCRMPGAFADAARRLQVGDALRLGELRGGALHYDPDWQARPLWLLAAGTGLAPLYGVLREALRQEHQGAIRLLHVAHEPADHYLASELQALAAQHANLQVELVTAAQLPAALAELRLVSRQTLALLCGHPVTVDSFARRLYMAGLPRSQMLADVFLTRA